MPVQIRFANIESIIDLEAIDIINTRFDHVPSTPVSRCWSCLIYRGFARRVALLW
jgi:hypothetical protein